MVFHWRLRDSKSPQVSKTLLCIMTDLNNAVVWMVSTRRLISNSARPCTNPLLTVPSDTITTGIIVTFIFQIFFNSLARSRYLSFFSLSFNFTQLWTGTAKSTIRQVLFSFFSCWSSYLAEIRWSVCISKSQKSLCISLSRIDSGLCIYQSLEWSNFNFLHNSHWIILSTQSCLVLYSFCDCLLQSLIVWLIVSSPLVPLFPSRPVRSFGNFSCSTVFFNSLARSRYLSFFSLSFNFTLWSAGVAKFTILQVIIIIIHWPSG